MRLTAALVASLVAGTAADCTWTGTAGYLNLGVNRGGCFACESLAGDTDALVEYCRAICLADSSCKSFEIAAGYDAFYFYEREHGMGINCCIEYADSTDTGSENFWISADDAGTCAYEASLWTTYEPDDYDISACELDEGLDTSAQCYYTGWYESWEPDHGEIIAVRCDVAEGCSQAWCTSPDGDGGHDCWAGSSSEECSCSEGEAKETGAEHHDGDNTYYEYTCCTDGSGEGPECGDCCDDVALVIVIILTVLFSVGFCAVIICVYICHRNKQRRFQQSQQFQQPVAQGYGPQQQGIVMGQIPPQQGIVMGQQQGVVVGQTQGVVIGQPQQQGVVVQGLVVK